MRCIEATKVVPCSITSVGLGADPGFLAVRLYVTVVTLVVNRCLLSTRPAVTFPANEITDLWP